MILNDWVKRFDRPHSCELMDFLHKHYPDYFHKSPLYTITCQAPSQVYEYGHVTLCYATLEEAMRAMSIPLFHERCYLFFSKEVECFSLGIWLQERMQTNTDAIQNTELTIVTPWDFCCEDLQDV